MNDWNGDPISEFDAELANAYVGKYILVGVTYFDAKGNQLDQTQLHGEIMSVTAAGIHIELRGKRDGESWNMPPDFDSISPARPGIYSLRATGETVENPDFVATWSITQPEIH